MSNTHCCFHTVSRITRTEKDFMQNLSSPAVFGTVRHSYVRAKSWCYCMQWSMMTWKVYSTASFMSGICQFQRIRHWKDFIPYWTWTFISFVLGWRLLVGFSVLMSCDVLNKWVDGGLFWVGLGCPSLFPPLSLMRTFATLDYGFLSLMGQKQWRVLFHSFGRWGFCSSYDVHYFT